MVADEQSTSRKVGSVMTGFGKDRDRKVIPRWRTFSETLKFKELDALATPQTSKHIFSDSDFLTSKVKEWEKHQTVGHASDLVGAALTLGRQTEVSEAAKFLLRSCSKVPPWAKELAERALRPADNTVSILDPPNVESSNLYAQVRSLRELVRAESRDPITWVELSRAYTTLGQNEKADRTMGVALQLATNNRFVLRSAGRLWVHMEDPEKAHDAIVRSERTPYDPWLLAAEIAIGSICNRRSKYIKTARRMLSDKRFSNYNISELASAVATLEKDYGNKRKSERLFRLSLEDPTENSIAQASWAARHDKAIRIDNKQFLEYSYTFEARSWSLYHDNQWEQVITECRKWQFDQPFSSWPGILGSYVAAVALEDYETSLQFARRGVMANRLDFTLLNNMAFALGNLGRLDEARKELSKARGLASSSEDEVVLQATRGLLAFRGGDIEEGRRFYEAAIRTSARIKDRRLFALAYFFYALQEHSYSGLENHSESVVSKSLQALNGMSDPISNALKNKLTQAVM
ncbi:MAG: tetratricopeptide repeat protein [Halieaceae bacterium]|nr:tetratricopeptide repeat protein [Halieaceae bacterium]